MGVCFCGVLAVGACERGVVCKEMRINGCICAEGALTSVGEFAHKIGWGVGRVVCDWDDGTDVCIARFALVVLCSTCCADKVAFVTGVLIIVIFWIEWVN